MAELTKLAAWKRLTPAQRLCAATLLMGGWIYETFGFWGLVAVNSGDPFFRAVFYSMAATANNRRIDKQVPPWEP